MALALLLSWFFTAAWIVFMRSLDLGKKVRADGPKTHLAKEGTPSMGGVAFLLAAFLAYWLLGRDGFFGLWLLGLGFALLGLLDDLGGSLARPLRAREKLAFQSLMALVFALWAVRQVAYTPWPILDVLLILLAVVGAANAFNFTDGLDGLLASVTALLLLPFYPYPFAQTLLGSLLGFLWHNAPRAKVFMGDTGSQALGGMVAGLFALTGKLWLLPLAAIVPVLEVLSVVIQVLYFRKTGRRLLRMSPLHHHLELSGWEEAKIVFRFAILTALATALAFVGGGA
ncbi:phospho-N-acetylmuramoyl-pentapeptide-transferase [Thermus caldifontis]|uniref:phospho-N-acetylmuramoyl-pentapeptide- transferase n=1 Tax=Thermus caldifontis TaxID=1930763 RepID=UPI000DF1C0C9|nr:phospho-N-acetylmuramoyl-pentapeptide-transferase [Thermus caldifontis]